MKDLIFYTVMIVLGYLFGNKICKASKLNIWASRVQTTAIVILLYTMGTRMGANPEVTGNLRSIGLISAGMTLIIMLFSAGFASVARRCIGLDRKARMKETVAEDREMISPSPDEEVSSGGQKKMAVIIILSVTLGMLSGYFLVPKVFSANLVVFNNLASALVNLGLFLLLFIIGYNMGREGTVLANVRKVGPRILIFPFFVIAGAAFAAVICCFMLEITMQEALAISAGFGWYSLAPNIILEAGLAKCGAISFMHCIMREYFSLLLVPIVAKKVGYMEAIGLCGATAMGVCLPIVERSTRSDVAVYSFICGLVHTASVPILLPLIVG